MPERNIPPAEWPRFLESFSHQHEGWLVSVERLSPQGRLIETEDRPLSEILAEDAGRIMVLVGRKDDHRLPYAVREPRNITLLQNDAGIDEGLKITDAAGVTTLVRFRTPARPETIDGIAA